MARQPTIRPGADPRASAARALREVLGAGRSLDQALDVHLDGFRDARDRALAQEIAFGVLRFLPRLQLLASHLLERPLPARDLDVACLLWAGLYQLLYLRVAEHAAVGETVGAAALLGKPWARGLLNGVLRNFLRRREQLLAMVDADPTARACFPGWLLERLRQAWPDDWEALVDASNQRPPLCLRVNPMHGERDAYAERLAEQGLATQPLRHAPQGLRMERPVGVEALPGFDLGWVSIQDGAAQLAAPLLGVRPGDWVLDACAAPGGKTTHLLELAAGCLDLTAVDGEASRLEPLEDNLRRLGFRGRVLAGDLRDPATGWADRSYQGILLDVPCSATGVIRHHPDIKWLRRPGDLDNLTRLQGELLDAVWPHLAVGGILVYVTCSLLPDENQQQVRAFLQRTPDARELPIEAPWGRALAPGRQVLTGEDGMDGFYFARMTRLGSPT